MAFYLTIPDVVESEPMLSVASSADGLTFGITINVGDTASRMMQAHADGRQIPLVVLTTDTQIIALDSVHVGEFWISGHPEVAYVSFAAEAVRFL